MEEQENALDMKRFLHIISKRKILICVITICAVIISGVLSFFVIKPTYQSETSIIVGRPQNQIKNEKLDNSDVMMYQNLIKTYSEIVTSKPVLDDAVSKLDGKINEEQLEKAIRVTSQQGTQILQIDTTDHNADNAYKMADAVTNSFIDKSQEIFPSSGVQLSIMNDAEKPDKPIKPKKFLNMAIAFLLGSFAAFGLSVLLEYMDNTVKSEKDLNKYLQIPVIGIIPDQPNMQE